jgi:carboxyl-terminal processing protease
MRRFVGLFITILVAVVSHAETPVKEKKGLACNDIQPIVEHGILPYHVTFNSVTPNLEERAVTQFIKKMDPSKRYLLKTDVDEIQKTLKGVFAKVKSRNCADISAAHNIFKKRMDERLEYAKKILNAKDFKFDPSTEIVLDSDKREYPANKAKADEFHRKFIQFQISNYLASDMKLDEAKQFVVRNYERSLKRLNEVSEDDMYSMYMDAVARSFDPHSSYFNRSSREDFEIEMSLSLEGIGATLSSQDGFTVVEQLIPGGAAAQSGLIEPQDKIIQVRKSKDQPMENVIEMDLRDVVSRIRGPKGTPVEVVILRKVGDKQERKTVSLIRDKINLEDEAASLHVIEKEASGKKYKVGLVNLPSFYADARRGGRSSATDVKKLLKQARDENVQGVVLDVSSNGGGSLEDAVRIAGLFFKTGNVVKQASGKSDSADGTLADPDPAVDWNGPLVVLTSRISASASEIVAGTMKDYKRGIIVGGDHTFGKGSIQSVMNLRDFGALKVTVGMFFTPGGFSTQHRGVEGDIILPGAYATDEVGEKSLDYSLPPKKISPFISKEAYVKDGADVWKEVTPDLITDLKKKSEARVASSTDFKKILEDLKKAKKKVRSIKLAEAMKDQSEAQEQKKKGPKTKEQKVADYLKRADVQESVQIMTDWRGKIGAPSAPAPAPTAASNGGAGV